MAICFGLCLANTWFGGHKTWENTNGHRRRIDYVAVDSCYKPALKESWLRDAEIAPGGRADHSALAVSFDVTLLAGLVTEQKERAKDKTPGVNIDPASLCDRSCRLKFQRCLHQHIVDEQGNIDEEVEKVRQVKLNKCLEKNP